MKPLLRRDSGPWRAVHILQSQEAAGSWDLELCHSREVTIYRNSMLNLQHFIPLMRYAMKLKLFGPPPDWGTLPWIALRVLTIKPFALIPPRPLSFNHITLVDLLRAAPHLTDLVLDFTVEEDILEPTEPQTTTHSKLESVSFHLHHCMANGWLFGVQIDAPSLRNVTLLTFKHGTLPNATFHCMWESPTNLTLPRLEDYEVADIAELVRWYPRVNTLEVEGPNIDTLFIFMHTLLHHIPPRSEPLPLPQLTSLWITNTDVRGDTLIELVENRLRHVQAQTPNIRPITRITMYDSPGVTPLHWSRIQELLEEGGASLEMRSGDDMEG
jgi:hypothetical protein